MVDNSLAKFNTTSEYNDFKSSSAYTVPNVSWIVKENAIASEPYLYPLTSGIVVHKNGVFKEVSYDDFNEHYDSIIAKGYSIEGVIAVPSTHTPDGTTRIISLKLMSTGSPETGVLTSGSTMYWGGNGVDLSGLTNYGYVAKVNNVPGETTISVNYESGYIPSDFFISGTGAQSVVDDKAKYSSVATQSAYCPSPYITGDNPNPLYGITGISSSLLNVLSDMDGSANTEVLIENATAQTNWRTASTITNSYSPGYYPAACCCKRYGTTGLPSGSWYLPAMGELGYVVARLGSINAILTLIMSKDPSLCVDIYYDSYLTSSNEVYDTGYNTMYLGYCRTLKSNKMSASYVRAFSAVHSKPMVF